MAERNRLTKTIYTKTSSLTLKELRKMLKTERTYINSQIRKITKKGLTSSAAIHYKMNPISLSKKLSYKQIRKEVLKAKTFFSSKDWTIEGAEEYSAERKRMYESFTDLLNMGEDELSNSQYGFGYGEQLANEIFDLYEDVLSNFPTHLRKVLESDQESILEEIEEELKYSQGASYDEIRHKIYQSTYDRIGDFFGTNGSKARLR